MHRENAVNNTGINIDVDSSTAENDQLLVKKDNIKNNPLTLPVFSVIFALSITHLLSLLFYAFQILLYSSLLLEIIKLSATEKEWILSLSPLNISALTVLLPLLVFSPISLFAGQMLVKT